MVKKARYTEEVRFSQEILKTVGLSPNNVKGIIDVCLGSSLHGSYWIVPDGFNGKFSSIYLYETRSSEVLALTAFTGEGRTVAKILTTTHKLSSNGALPKA